MNNYTFFNVNEYFALLPRLDRWLNPFEQLFTASIQNESIPVFITKRGRKKLDTLNDELFVEMQLMYSCIVKKRTIFHKKQPKYAFENVGHKLNICFRAVQPTSCDPEEFAKNYPEKRELETVMYPKTLYIDYKNHRWEGYFKL